MSRRLLTRRTALVGLSGAGGLALAGCDRLSRDDSFMRVLDSAEGLNLHLQRFLQGGDRALAREYAPSDIRGPFKPNGTLRPQTTEWTQLADDGFADYRLTVTGLVRHPLSLSLDQLRRLPQRTQITRHDCVEGWSCIGQWRGPQLGLLLRAAGLLPGARYVVFHCLDDLDNSTDGSGRYYESVDLVDAMHPQTILAHALNGAPLPVRNGAPLRVRIERQLGYKMAKYVQGVEVVADLRRFGAGKGGYWEDRGYAWYAGI